MKTEINLEISWILILITPLTTNMNSKYTVKKLLPTYISNQHHALTLAPSKMYSKVSFTKYSGYVPRNMSEKKKNF